jgi:hypothetical protein
MDYEDEIAGEEDYAEDDAYDLIDPDTFVDGEFDLC